MDVTLDADQQLLVDMASRLAEDLGTTAVTVAGRDDPGEWEALVGAGLVGMRLPEPFGGSAGGAEVALVAEQLGRFLCQVPFLGQAVLAPELVAAATPPGGFEARSELLAGIVAGERRVTVGLDAELGALGRTGAPAVAWDARGASHAVLVDPGGHLALVELDHGGEAISAVDLTREVRAIPAEAGVADLGVVPAEHVARVEALALTVLAADLVGVMQAAVQAAVAYVRDRVQFGVAVGSFQAVQHLAADALVRTEASRSSMWHAAWAIDALDGEEALLAARQAKAYASEAGREVVEIQTQLLGGIAITWEELAHLRVRRALFDRLTLGDEHHQHDAIAAARLGGP